MTKKELSQLAKQMKASKSSKTRMRAAKVLGRIAGTASGGGVRPGSGAPRSKAPRCECGANTLKRARARAFDCCKKAGLMEHKRKGKK